MIVIAFYKMCKAVKNTKQMCPQWTKWHSHQKRNQNAKIRTLYKLFLTSVNVSKCRKNNHYSFHHKCDVGRIVGSLDLESTCHNKTTRANSKGDCHSRDKILYTLNRLKLANILHSKGRFWLRLQVERETGKIYVGGPVRKCPSQSAFRMGPPDLVILCLFHMKMET
jgi:hypothetical protein